MMLFLRLFYEFLKTGLFAIGGGMATIPFLYDLSDKTGWFSHNDLANMIAVGESTPGPIGVNMATYVGYVTGMNVAGLPTAILGALVATIGLITPSVIIILIIAAILKSFRNNRFVESAFYGLRPASTGLIASAGLSVVVNNLIMTQPEWSWYGVNWKGLVLAVVLWLMTNVIPSVKKMHPIVFIAISALAGIVFSM